MKYIAIVSARMGSTRFPGKVMAELWRDDSVLEILIKRLKLSENIDKIVVGTTTEPEDQLLEQICRFNNIDCHCVGNKDSSLTTVLKTAEIVGDQFKDDIAIIDITADCPFIDPYEIDNMINDFKYGDYDYLSNCMVRSFPIGFDIQIYKYDLLKKVEKIVINPVHRSHSGWNIWAYSERLNTGYLGSLHFGNIIAKEEYCFPDWRIVVDYPEDLELLKIIINGLNNINFSYKDVIGYLKARPELLAINKDCKQKNAGSEK
jgi:spore coat polysaccharide biosynthesis protein SpsF